MDDPITPPAGFCGMCGHALQGGTVRCPRCGASAESWIREAAGPSLDGDPVSATGIEPPVVYGGPSFDAEGAPGGSSYRRGTTDNTVNRSALLATGEATDAFDPTAPALASAPPGSASMVDGLTEAHLTGETTPYLLADDSTRVHWDDEGSTRIHQPVSAISPAPAAGELSRAQVPVSSPAVATPKTAGPRNSGGDLRTQPMAPLGKRFAAYLLDALVLNAIGVVIYLLVIALAMGGNANAAIIAYLVGSILLSVFGIWYHCFFNGVKCGTPGKRWTGLALVDMDTGGPIGPGRAFQRQLCLGLMGLPLMLGYLTIFNDPLQRGWHDKMARSRVVQFR